ncbi:MAG: ATP-binding protein [Fibromonadales bacterium]|nr:ATP-binding protein [Fibromonadales bacterium]
MTKKFQQKLIFSFLLIFAVSTLGIAIFEQHRARELKKYALEKKLETYAELIAKDFSSIELLPENLRITLMDKSGNVHYDNVVEHFDLENHLDRQEMKATLKDGVCSSIRESASNKNPYLYYAKNFDNKIVRVALPYDEHVKVLLKTNNEFLFFVIFVFLMGLALILYVGKYFGKTVNRLRNFSKILEIDEVAIPKFSEDEFGEICENIADSLRKIKNGEKLLKENEKRLVKEKEKLLLHVQASAEGVCFFNADRTVAFYNGLFLQYFNIISNDSLTIGKEISLDEHFFNPMIMFLNQCINEDYYETCVSRQGSDFQLRMNVFEDRSFEMILIDVTARENTRRLKQEMTGNIAHELRTPVTSIRGFLEILLNNNVNEEKKQEFLQRAFSQTQVLSELISDMSLLTKIDAKAQSLVSERVNISQVIKNAHEDTSVALQEKNIRFASNVPENVIISGNQNLLYSIFRNLIENVIRHAGTDIDIFVKMYEVKAGKAYFIFGDNGNGIEEDQHLSRLFERFYRVHDGRTRNTGGSGLGLSIVKNSVLFHEGTISVRRGKDDKGLEFLFSLRCVR